MAEKLPGIELSVEAEDKLKLLLDEHLSLGYDFRRSSEWDDLHEMYWRQYFAQPDSKTKDTPWPGASNMFLPLTQVIVEGIIAQEFEAMLSNDPTVKVVPYGAQDAEEAEALSRYYGEYYWKYVVPMKQFGCDWLLDNTVDGTSAVKVRQEKDYRIKRNLSIAERAVFEDSELQGETVPVSTRTEYDVSEEAIIEEIMEVRPQVADLDQIYMAPDSGPSLQWPECAWYFQEIELTWEELLNRKRYGYKNIDDSLKGSLADRDLTAKEQLKRDREGTGDEVNEPTVLVTEHYMRYPLGGSYRLIKESGVTNIKQQAGQEDGYWEEIIVTYQPSSRTILRIVPLYRLYPDGKRPHVLNHYIRIPRYVYGTGIPSKMRHLNRAGNSIWNQMIDNGSLQNTPFYFYSPGALGVMPDILGLRPGMGIPTLDPRGINFPRMQGDTNFWLAASQQIQMNSEKVGGVSDVQLGRNPSTPNAPRTKGGMAMQISQGNVMFSRLVTVHAEAWLELFRKVHAIKRKTAPRRTEFQVRTSPYGSLKTMSVSRRAFDVDIEFDFVLNPNRQYEQQIDMQVFQLMTSIPYIAQNPNSVRMLAKDLYESLGKKNFEEVWPEQMPAMIQGPGVPPGQPAGPGAPAIQPPAPPMPGGMPPEISNEAPQGSEVILGQGVM